MEYKITYLTTVIMIIGLLTACEDPLKEDPASDVAVENFYNSADEFEVALNGVYSHLWLVDVFKDGNYYQYGDQTTDILISAGGNPGSIDAWDWSNTTNAFYEWWWNIYEPINEANKILQELEDIDFPAKDRIEGETLFLRALNYYVLNKMFHGVPIMTEPIEEVSEKIYKPRNTYTETSSFIVDDLRAAEEKLSPFNPNNHSMGRATAASAQGLLARVYASQEEWQDAIDAARRAIDHADIFLEPDYHKIWDPDFENGSEHLFSIAHGQSSSSSDLIGNHNAWLKSVHGFTLTDGTTVDFARNEDVRGNMWWVGRDFYKNTPDTYRKRQTMRDWMPYYIPKGEEVITDTLEFPEEIGPQLVKYHHLDDNYNIRPSVNDNLIRTSEMHLIIAESLNELHGGPTPEAVEAINKVRRRARAVGTSMEQPESVYSDISTNISQTEFRDKVIEEFAREHIGEGLFREVLIRHQRYTTRSWSTGDVPTGNQEEHRRWYPVPSLELSRNDSLEQNPGYN